MNTKLIGGVLLVGGVSVIAYYFLFRKKKGADEKVDLSGIKADISLPENPFLNNQNLINVGATFNPSKDFVLTEKEKEGIRQIVGNIPANIDYTPNMQPIDIAGLERIGLGGVNWEEAIRKAGY
jgi:hypothetical protein